MIESDDLEFFDFDEEKSGEDAGDAPKKKRRRRRKPTTTKAKSTRKTKADESDEVDTVANDLADFDFDEEVTKPAPKKRVRKIEVVEEAVTPPPAPKRTKRTKPPVIQPRKEEADSDFSRDELDLSTLFKSSNNKFLDNDDDDNEGDLNIRSSQANDDFRSDEVGRNEQVRHGRPHREGNSGHDRGGYNQDRGFQKRGRFNNSNNNGGRQQGGYQQRDRYRDNRDTRDNRDNRDNRNDRDNRGDNRGGGGGGGGNRQFRDRGQNFQGNRQQFQGRRAGGRDRFERSRPHDTSHVELIGDLFEHDTPNEELVIQFGILELHPKGYGFLRSAKNGYFSEDSDPFVSSSVVEKFKLREGIKIKGKIGMGARGQGPRLKGIVDIDGLSIDDYMKLKSFDDLTPINPFEQIKLEVGVKPVTMRVMDLLTPIGKGQRALIVAPPRTGKTMLLQDIANSVSKNHPEIELIVLLIDERPEEVTEMQRMVRGDVIASSMDREVESHVRISQLIIERGKRIAEMGRDAFILLDSITRTARAFNKWVNNSGRTQTGGLDIKAMDIPKKMFGTARRFDEGGSLTVVGTALIDTGSRMDEAIFQEFKGTGNMEMVLSRDLADRRIWPSIDITKSGTRREEKILAPDQFEGIVNLRRSLVSMNPVEAMEQLIRILDRFPTNKEFLAKIKSVL